MIERGLCLCGCGQKTLIAKITNTARGQIKGQPVRCITGHNIRAKASQPNEARHADGITTITLRRRKGEPLLCYMDSTDYPLVSRLHWWAKKSDDLFYACADVRQADGSRKKIRMHMLLLPDAPEVDHQDHNGLNNRRENLRPATSSQNKWNQSKKKTNRSGYKGVAYNSRYRLPWSVEVKMNRRTVFYQRFASALAAAEAYDTAAVKYFGEFACLNFPR